MAETAHSDASAATQWSPILWAPSDSSAARTAGAASVRSGSAFQVPGSPRQRSALDPKEPRNNNLNTSRRATTMRGWIKRQLSKPSSKPCRLVLTRRRWMWAAAKRAALGAVASAWWPKLPGCRAQPSMPVWPRSRPLGRPRARGAEPQRSLWRRLRPSACARPVADASVWWTSTRACLPILTPWSSPPAGAIRCLRCAGHARARRGWPPTGRSGHRVSRDGVRSAGPLELQPAVGAQDA